MAWLEAKLERFRATMSPGQRWTALIAMIYAIAVLNFGGPSTTTVVQIPARSAAPAPAVRPVPVPDTSASPLAAPYSFVPGYDDAFSEPAPDTEVVEEEPASPPRIVVAVRPAEMAALPGRDDAAMANAFLAAARFEASTVTISADVDATCKELVAAGDVVIASEGLASLSPCLTAAGVTVIAFDENGTTPSNDSDDGAVLSSRRSVTDSIADIGRWGIGAGALKGKVGLVGRAATRHGVEAAAAKLRAAGVDVAAVAFLDDGPGATTQINAAALDFSAKGVEVVIFATGVAQQRTWVTQYRVLEPGARYVVSDVADGVRDETYPAFFDGALAHTSLRVPWFSRDNGETPLQLACRQRWEAAAGGAMRATEAVRVYSWCQHIELVDAGLRATGAGSFVERLRGVSLPSPLTSDLGAVNEGWGPTADAVLVWRASCGCWVEQRAFERRATA